jgi:hypothetical protein
MMRATLVTLVIAVAISPTTRLVNSQQNGGGGGDESSIAYCDGCWCIPEEGSDCPIDNMPPIEFSEELIANLRAISFDNPYSMTCDPFTQEDCMPTPALEQGGVCVVTISYEEDNEGDYPEGYSYR